MPSNRACRLIKRPPPGLVTREVFAFDDDPAPEPGPNQFRIKIEYISLDPAMRGWMNEGKSYRARRTGRRHARLCRRPRRSIQPSGL